MHRGCGRSTYRALYSDNSTCRRVREHERGERSSKMGNHRQSSLTTEITSFFFFQIYRGTMTLNKVKKRFLHLSRCRLSNRATTKITRSILSNDRMLKEWNSYLEFLSYHTCNTYYIIDNIIYYY